MKRFLEIVTFSCITLGILTSGTTEKKLRSVLHRNSLSEIQHDTTGFIHLMKVDSFKLIIFPPSSGVQFYKDGIVFLSPSKYEGKMLPKHISFGTNEAYYVVPVDSISGKHMIFSPSFSFSYPCEAITFSSDFKTMYFSKISEKEKKVKIFMAKDTSEGKKQSGWQSETTPLNFCKANSNYTHPSLSADEKLLVFASDKEGSFGGMDLFITRKEGDTWSAPENLGNFINTAGNEFFPFLDSDNNLFFSSDGLPGYGGYDVFTCKFNGENWDKPLNLSGRINSENDDIAFIINKTDSKTAFYTTRRKSGKDEMQLFKVTLNKEASDNKLLTISYIFNGKPLLKPGLTTATTVPGVKPDTEEPAKKEPEIAVIKKELELKDQQTKKRPEEKKVPETTIAQTTLPGKKSVNEPESKVKLPETKVETIKQVSSVSVENKDEVIYRVQISSGNNKPQGTKVISVNGKSYNTYEYLYLKIYRTTIGEFSTLKGAVELQNALRRSGQKQAFVVAFKNNVRSTDPALFK